MTYASANIFSDPRINALCDRIYALMYQAMPASESQDLDYIYKAFLLSGRPAAILQGATTQPVDNIVFQTSNEILFSWCRDNLAKRIGNCKSIIFKERILIYPNDYIFEILFSQTPLSLVIYQEDINLNNIEIIPEETL